MCEISKRAFNRNCCEARIQYSVFNGSEKYLDAVMYNASEGGMYFESEYHIHPGEDIRIKIVDEVPDIDAQEARHGYRGEVMWCRKVFNGAKNSSSYGVGIRFMVNICDKCGEKVLFSEIHRTENFLFFCSNCLRQMENIENGKIRDCLEQYLMGNIL
jgi:hypothetical protein